MFVSVPKGDAIFMKVCLNFLIFFKHKHVELVLVDQGPLERTHTKLHFKKSHFWSLYFINSM